MMPIVSRRSISSALILLMCVLVGYLYVTRARNIEARNGLVPDSYAFDFGDVDQPSHSVHQFTAL